MYLIKKKIIQGKHVALAMCCLCGFVGGASLHGLIYAFANLNKSISWNGGEYTGDTTDGIPNGCGQYAKDGVIYTGYWDKREMTNGTFENSVLTYEGDFKDWKFNGYGVARYKDGRAYWGYWKNDYKEGLGLLRKRNGELSFGQFNNGITRETADKDYKTGDLVYGIDVSRYQGSISWQDLFLSCDTKGIVNGTMPKEPSHMQPILFALIKSTQGANAKDPFYENNYFEAKRCGKICGSYHFLMPDASGKAQANFFIKNSSLQKGDFPPLLDVEIAKGKNESELTHLIPIAKEWIKTIKAHYGISPIIYTNMHIYNKYIVVDRELSNYDIWIASPGNQKPRVGTCVIWQFSHFGVANGISENVVDLNLFNGNYRELQSYIRNKGV